MIRASPQPLSKGEGLNKAHFLIYKFLFGHLLSDLCFKCKSKNFLLKITVLFCGRSTFECGTPLIFWNTL